MTDTDTTAPTTTPTGAPVADGTIVRDIDTGIGLNTADSNGSNIARVFTAARRELADLAQLGTGDRDIDTLVRDATDTVHMRGNALWQERLDLAADQDLIPEAGYHRLRAQAELDATAAMTDHLDRVEAALDAARATAVVNATPAPPADSGQQLLLRDEIRTLLDGVRDNDLPGRMLDLAQHSDRRDLVGTLLSSWGASYLEARGVDSDTRDMLQIAAASVAADRGATDAERTAGRRYNAVKRAVAGLGALRTAATLAVETWDAPTAAQLAELRSRSTANAARARRLRDAAGRG